MARKSDNPISGMNIDWGRDPSNGLPYSGRSVQNFIKQTFDEKVGAGLFDVERMALYLFKDENDKEEFSNDRSRIDLIIGTIPLNFDTTQRRIRITPTGNTTVNISVNAKELELEMALQAEQRELGEPVWEPTNQDIGVRVYLDARSTGHYEEIPELAQTVLATDGVLSVDVRKYLPVGMSRIRFYFYAIDDEALSSSIVWNITLAEMYIEEWGNTWYKPLIENISDGYYHLGGFKIVGTVAKMLHIEVSTALAVVAYYQRDIGTMEAIETPYMFTRNEGLDFANPVDDEGAPLQALSTGIYSVKVWLTAGELSTEDTAIVYNIMYIAPGDEYSASLAIMNYSGREVNNYDESAHLCDYAVYNAGQTYGAPTITITPYIEGTPETPIVITSQIETSKRYELRHSINLVTSRENLTVRYRVAMEGNYQEGVSPINNAEIFPSVDGAAFYLNTSLRSNGESSREVVYNTANNGQVALSSTVWNGMSWVDGIDGWYQDENGRKCLLLPARTKLTIPYTDYNFFPGENITIELCYKVSNVSDYDENVITMGLNPTGDNFLGLRVKPTNITVHSGSDTTSANDIYQGTNLCDEEVVHLVLTIQKAFGEVSDQFNLVTGYINGVKNFQFSYPKNAIWSNSGLAIFGSDTADLCLYMVRAYSKPISSSGAEDNWLNSLATLDEKTAYRHFIDSVLGGGSRRISYDKIKDEGKYNFFVVEMTTGNPNVPSTMYPDGGRSNIEMHFGKDENGQSRSDWDWKIYDVETKGQGTTSMNYWLWNIRWRIDKTDSSKKRDVAYYDTPVISGGMREFVELPKHSSKTVKFDGDNHPEVKRITAKINFASSMQSHKMGATKAYNILHNSLLEGAMKNEAQVIAASQNKPIPTVAVYQYPAYGFQRNPDGSHTFIGLFTIGPDKGDKPTFGWDLVDEEDLVTLEGVDHTPQMTKFNVPWDEQAVYYVNSGGDGFLATKAPSGNYQNAVEVGNAGTADTASPSAAMPVLEATFKDAYDVIYNNSTLIFPIALNDATWGALNASAVLARINNNVGSFRGTSYNDRLSYTDMEFWIEGEYVLYHYEYESEQYVSGYKLNGEYNSPLNLLTDTGISSSELEGLTLDEQNEMFKEARRARFLTQAPEYWEMNELVFNYVYLLVFGATDNFAKNQYPYYMGGKWRFRQDDLDTIEDIDNNGGQTKPAYIEFEDSASGSPYFAGSNSVLWNLVHESMWLDGSDYTGITSMGRHMMEQMSLLSGGNNIYDGFYKFFQKYFWNNAQEYFPPSAYNIDGSTKYEAAWLTGRSFSANPLRQSLGNHYSAERLWVRNRALYCLSLFGAGAFGNYEHEYLGRIQFRPVITEDFNSITVTPSTAMYPCLIIGDNDIRPTARRMAGVPYEFTSLAGEGQTVYTIQGVNYLTDLGDLRNLILSQQDGGTLNISGKKLRTIKLGDETEEVTTNVSTISIDSVSGLPCLEIVDLRNAEEMTGTLDLTNCKRIKEVYTEGTSIGAVMLPRGSKIEKLHLSDNVTSLSYQTIKYLEDLVLPSDASGIILLFLEECDALDGMSTLEEIYNTTGQSLQYIRLLWGTERPVTGPQVRMLANIMQDLDKDGNEHIYNGIDSSGSGSSALAPILEGKLLASAFYQSDIDLLTGGSEPEDSDEHPGMKVIQASYFGPLYITYDLGSEYIPFVDMDAVPAFYGAGIGDGIGVTMAEAEETSSIGSAFTGKTDISSLNELSYFTSITSLVGGTSSSGGAFRNCTALTEITIPVGVTSIGAYAFAGCTSLSSITFLRNTSGTISVGTDAFLNAPITKIDVPSLEQWMRFSWSSANYLAQNYALYIGGSVAGEITLPSQWVSVGQYAFFRCTGITSVTIPSGYTTIGQYAFARSSITSITIPSSVTSIGGYAFYTCSNLANLTIPSSVPTISTSVIGGVGRGGTIYIGGSLVDGGRATDSKFSGTNLVVCGYWNAPDGGYPVATGTNVTSIRIGGDLVLSNSAGANGLVDAGAGQNSNLEFVEIMGTFSGRVILSTGNSRYIKYGTEIHLGYNGMACTASQAVVSDNNISAIYIGPGESEAGDQAIIDTYYLTDPSWASVSNKLHTWYSYNGTYKNQ